MPLFPSEERGRVDALAALTYGNPFDPAFVEREREILGDDYEPHGTVWSYRVGPGDAAVMSKLGAVAERLVDDARVRLLGRTRVSETELGLYADLVVHTLFERYADELYHLHVDPTPARRRVRCYDRFQCDVAHFLRIESRSFPDGLDAPHLFACFFQIRRAFGLIFRHIIGASRPAAELRASVWQSIFTHDMRRYRRSLYRHMRDVTTLVVGLSGTGKELVARAIGLSRYVPFDPERETFAGDLDGAFHPLNLSALSPTLIESELFGHRKGAFTGRLRTGSAGSRRVRRWARCCSTRSASSTPPSRSSCSACCNPVSSSGSEKQPSVGSKAS